jgi:hypothetical protein
MREAYIGGSTHANTYHDLNKGLLIMYIDTGEQSGTSWRVGVTLCYLAVR